MSLRRSSLLLLSVLLPWVAQAQVERADVNLNYVAQIAEARAKRKFESPRGHLPDVLKQDNLDYDKYRKIRFRGDHALWLGDKLPFHIQFFHPGYIYQEPVNVNEFTQTHVQRIRFVQDFFDYGDLDIQRSIPADTGYAGFRIHYPLNQPGDYAELASFIGASYYRMLGKGQRYGQSARGLAMDCGEPGGEEFPIFTDFWLGKPATPDAKEMTLYALLDSVSCTGAYQMRIVPGEATVVDIEVVLYFREEAKIKEAQGNKKPITTLGMAPLTSMFWFGENSERKFDDYRPEVHDSDGLLMHMDGGEIVWRPLNNASVMRHSMYATKNIRGFGLLQRDREYTNYHELFNLYHQTPSVWITPKGDWGEGEVHLVELTTNYEGLDNIVAFWNPKQKPTPLQPYRFSYQQAWTRDPENKLSPTRVVATRVGAELHDAKKRQVHLDFEGPGLDGLDEKNPPVAVTSCTPNAKIYDVRAVPNPFKKGWRIFIKFEPNAENKDPVDLRCTLKSGDKTISETWSYLWSPP